MNKKCFVTVLLLLMIIELSQGTGYRAEARAAGLFNRVMDKVIDRVTPEVDPATRQLQKDAVRAVVDPRPSKSDENYQRMYDSAQRAVNQDNQGSSSNSSSHHNYNQSYSGGRSSSPQYHREELKSSGLPGRFPEASIRNLSHSDVAGLSKDDLAIMRNEIYARHGYIFKVNRKIAQYFIRQSWYVPKYNNVDSMLSSVEKSNAYFIRKIEKQR